MIPRIAITTIDSITQEIRNQKHIRQKLAARMARRYFIETLFLSETEHLLGGLMTDELRSRVEHELSECVCASQMWVSAYCDEAPAIAEAKNGYSITWPEIGP